MMRTKLAALLALAAVALTGCGFHGLYGAPLPGGANLGSNPYTLTIYFDNVLDLVPQSAVKVNDVAVGRVESVALSSDNDPSGDKASNGWTAKVEVEVNSDVQLPANARAEVRITSLLGEKYVALEQPLSKPSVGRLARGATIPITRTGSAPETEEVLGALSLLLNGGGLSQIHIITTELNKALSGNTGAVRDLLTQLNTFVTTVDNQKNEIIAAIGSVNRLAVTLRRQQQTLVNALDTLPQAFQVLKDNRSRLTTLLTSLSNLGTVATRVITETQAHLVSSLKELAPAVNQLAAAGSNLPQALKIAGTFPFSLTTTLNAVKGDYANLHAVVDLNLSNELCALSKQLCSVSKLLPTSQSSSSQTATGTDSSSESVLQPNLLGAGG